MKKRVKPKKYVSAINLSQNPYMIVSQMDFIVFSMNELLKRCFTRVKHVVGFMDRFMDTDRPKSPKHLRSQRGQMMDNAELRFVLRFEPRGIDG